MVKTQKNIKVENTLTKIIQSLILKLIFENQAAKKNENENKIN